jgi:hypothetical protein
MSSQLQEKAFEWTIRAAFRLAAALALIGFVIFAGELAIQILGWLQSGIWPSYSTRAALIDWELPVPHSSWIGVQRIIDTALTVPFGLTAFVACALPAWFLFKIANEAYEQRNNNLRGKKAN